jgi:hypothetical protein
MRSELKVLISGIGLLVGRARIMAGTELMEYICQEDNYDLQHISGPALGPGGAR